MSCSHCTKIRDLTLKCVDSSDMGGFNLWSKIGNTLDILLLKLTNSDTEREIQKIQNCHVSGPEIWNLDREVGQGVSAFQWCLI